MLLCNLWLCPGSAVAAVGGAAADVHPDGRHSQEGEDRGGGQEEEVQELQVRTAFLGQMAGKICHYYD